MATELPVRPITVPEYHKMFDLGIFEEDERVELLDGLLVAMPPAGRGHVFTAGLVLEQLIEKLGKGVFVASEASVPLGPRDEPQPDIVVFPRDILKTKSSMEWRVGDLLAVVEVADSSLRRDTLVKQRIYARGGVAEYLVVDVQKRRVLRYRDPAGDSYSAVDELTPGATFALLAVPAVLLEVAAFFPPE